jgi:hypothetical protein
MERTNNGKSERRHQPYDLQDHKRLRLARLAKRLDALKIPNPSNSKDVECYDLTNIADSDSDFQSCGEFLHFHSFFFTFSLVVVCFVTPSLLLHALFLLVLKAAKIYELSSDSESDDEKQKDGKFSVF